MAKLTKAQQAERAEAIERLREWVKPGDTVYVILRHVSKSGMSRTLSLVVVDRETGHDLHISRSVALACGIPYTEHHGNGALKIGGCGFDAGSEAVYLLGRALWPDGGPVEHSQRFHQESRDGNTVERDGGYLLRHRWL